MGTGPQNIDTILSEAIEIKSVDERAAFLDQACREDAELRQRLDKLVRDHFRAGSVFLEEPPAEISATVVQPITEKPGTQIGPYKLLQQIGEGGMGAVYMAEQTTPVERRVALKIIKPGMDTRQVIARFEAERQALALMDHPNIARVFDAGMTDSGRPYFVMELVKGMPITAYCDEQHLTPKERLELFIPVCLATQHAHQKGIIHRDLKPSNILVALYDGQPVPKVIDFGVAKATTQKLTEKTMFTQYGQVVGTLEYMSPEQAQINQLDIDTRSDIYSLGVVLYELLTGVTPLDRQRLRSVAFVEMMRMIREEEPPRPSLRLSTIDTLPSVATNRRTEPQKLRTLFRGELDWIVMKSLEKDRARRYESANAFAQDVQRHLRDETVLACPPSTAYRLKKFMRRNRTAIMTVCLAVATLALGLIGTAWQTIRATQAERRTRVQELVRSLPNADIAQVSVVVSELGELRKLADPLLRAELVKSEDGSAAKLHLSLALLPVDKDQIEYLSGQLPVCSLDQFPVLRDELVGHRDEITEWIWRYVRDGEQPAAQRFQAAAALARYAPDDERWNTLGPFVAQYLTASVSPVHYGQWLKYFQPASAKVTKPLVRIHAGRARPTKQRELAALALAAYLRDRPAELVDVIVLSDEMAEFAPLINVLREQQPSVVRPNLVRHMQSEIPDRASMTERDAHWRLQSTAAVALVQLGWGDDVWSHLRFTSNPSLRSLIIYHFAKLETDPRLLAAQLRIEPDVSVRRALVQSLGGIDLPADAGVIIDELRTMYSNNPDPGIHSSTSWALRRWGQTLNEVPASEPVLAGEQKQRIVQAEEIVRQSQQAVATYEREQLPERQLKWEARLKTSGPSEWATFNEGLVDHFPLDETEGDQTANAISERLGGTYQGQGPPEWVPGVLGNGLRLYGDRLMAFRDAHNPERTKPFSIGLWFFSESEGVLWGGINLLKKTDKGSFGRGLRLGLLNGNHINVGIVHEQFDVQETDNRIQLRSARKATVKQWHHVMFTYDGSSSATGVTVYLDGAPAPVIVEADWLADSIGTVAPLQLVAGHGWPIRFDDLRIFKRELSAEQVQHVYESTLRSILRLPVERRTGEQRLLLSYAFRSQHEPLRKLKRRLAESKRVLHEENRRDVRRWFVNASGHPMVIFPKPSSQGDGSIDYTYAMSSHEVTVADYRKFKPEKGGNPNVAKTLDSPITRVTWYQAAEYCNWLTLKELGNEDQCVYLPNKDGKFDEGMGIKKNFPELLGYRLPTEAEWVYACRAGTSSSYCFGEPLQLLGRYCHYVLSSGGHTHPVGSKLPNDAGMFDMHGNVWEWSQGPQSVFVRNETSRAFHGGAFNHEAGVARSEFRTLYPPFLQTGPLGFRIARSYRLSY